MITHFGINDRDQVQTFQATLHKRNMHPSAKRDDRLSTAKLGRNWGGFVYEKDDKKLLVLIDSDDGSGGTPSDCKIVWSTMNELLHAYRPHDYLILKSQVNVDEECNKFYPFKRDVHPIGIFSNNPSAIFNVKSGLRRPEVQDIDVFFSGGKKFYHLNPYVWPKDRDVRYWWPGASIRGYEKLLDIKRRRPDINMQIFDGILPPAVFYDHINRSKVCIELPGIGLSSRKFYEYLVLGKCVISLRQQLTPWECAENVHYSSLGIDLDFSNLESTIDSLLADEQKRRDIEKNVEGINGQLTLEYMVSRAENIINDKIKGITDRVVHIDYFS